MTEVEQPQFNTLAERIAALNQQRNFQAPTASGKRAPPPPPPPVRSATISPGDSDAVKKPSLPARPVRAATEQAPPPLPRRTTANSEKPGPPPLPSRNSQQSSPPALPARSPSVQSTLTIPTPGLGRRDSNASDISYQSTVSSLSLGRTKSSEVNGVRKLPPTLEQAKLPPLPPTRRELEAKAKEVAQQQAQNSAPSLPSRQVAEPPVLPRRTTEPSPAARPSLPPRLPSRPAKSPAVSQSEAPSPALPARRLPPPPSSAQPKSALQCGFNSKPRNPPTNDAPPPIPLSSKPNISQINALASRPVPAPQQASQSPSCLICRDFSGPDSVAAQYPRDTLPRSDPVGFLAAKLCNGFPSPTDKARAIFAWCHHNISYDVYGFFNDCIKRGQTVEETIFDGLAVCEGYAKVFESIATRAGLQCVVISGHGKGFGHVPGQPASSVTDRQNHAWNAVRIDNGEWKLVDPCWGAGHLCDSTGQNLYKQKFSPSEFTKSNEAFGRKHFPSDAQHFYRKDGRVLTFEEYWAEKFEGPQWMGNAAGEGLDESNFAPVRKHISVYKGDPVVRFQFAKVCEHWDPEKNGKGKQMLFALRIGGLDGRKEDIIPMEADGFWWWLDVRARDLGIPGQKVTLIGFETIDNRDARGLTKEEFLRKKGRVGYSFTYLVQWELVE